MPGLYAHLIEQKCRRAVWVVIQSLCAAPQCTKQSDDMIGVFIRPTHPRAYRAEQEIRNIFIDITQVGKSRFLSDVIERHKLNCGVQRPCLLGFPALRVGAGHDELKVRRLMHAVGGHHLFHQMAGALFERGRPQLRAAKISHRAITRLRNH
jgi:hypothetical protein